ncbi:hypothetical protein HYT00_01515 [Candidatus Giovannonibacteria bacterium]|nr:hypothetical protein [Candidatus Giovannonibacteria bacterium]
MIQKILKILVNIIPAAIMIGLIPLVQNDYLLAVVYIVIIIAAFVVHREQLDFTAFFVGLFAMTISEYVFISTGAEIFTRQTFLGVMPIWLPVLWGYGFVVIERAVKILRDN